MGRNSEWREHVWYTCDFCDRPEDIFHAGEIVKCQKCDKYICRSCSANWDVRVEPDEDGDPCYETLGI